MTRASGFHQNTQDLRAESESRWLFQSWLLLRSNQDNCLIFVLHWLHKKVNANFRNLHRRKKRTNLNQASETKYLIILRKFSEFSHVYQPCWVGYQPVSYVSPFWAQKDIGCKQIVIYVRNKSFLLEWSHCLLMMTLTTIVDNELLGSSHFTPPNPSDNCQRRLLTYIWQITWIARVSCKTTIIGSQSPHLTTRFPRSSPSSTNLLASQMITQWATLHLFIKAVLMIPEVITCFRAKGHHTLSSLIIFRHRMRSRKMNF